MSAIQYFKNSIFKLQTEADFRQLALELFRYQAVENDVYGRYLNLLQIDAAQIERIEDIPFIPIRFFKSEKIQLRGIDSDFFFSSSATGGQGQSRHYLNDLTHYQKVSLHIYRQFVGEPSEQCIMALLPSYLEREGSSLIYMAEELIGQSADPDSGFFLYNHQDLIRLLKEKNRRVPTVVFGVSFALLDLAEAGYNDFSQIRFIETGGMKGRRRELIREELHQRLNESFGTTQISSEYGMTELMSQAYAMADGKFETPPWMKVMIRSITDPFQYLGEGRSGGINIIDLANVESCAFLETEDMGRVYNNGSFEVLGRYDHSEQRGCNLLIG